MSRERPSRPSLGRGGPHRRHIHRVSGQRARVGEPGEAEWTDPGPADRCADASRCRLARGPQRRAGKPARVGLPRSPPAALSLLHGDPRRPRRRPGRPAGDDGGGVARARRGAAPDRARSLALPDRQERIADGAASPIPHTDPARLRSRDPATRRPPGRRRRHRRGPHAAPCAPGGPRGAARATAERARDARAQRARLRRDRGGPRVLGGIRPANRPRGARIPERARRRARPRLRRGPAGDLGGRRSPTPEPAPAQSHPQLRGLLAVP